MTPTIEQLEKYYQDNFGHNDEAYHVAYWAGIAAYAHLQCQDLEERIAEYEQKKNQESDHGNEEK